MTPCPGCGAQESHCREALPRCRKLAADRQRIDASANGSEVETLRAENAALRNQLYSYSYQDPRRDPAR
jgi:hypothetical protein